MAGGADKHSKTEQPTPKRVKEARDKGQVAKSPDLAPWLGVLIGTWLLPPTVGNVGEKCQIILRSFAEVSADPTPARMTRALGSGFQSALLAMLPLLAGLMVMNLVVQIAQVGFHPSTKKLKPKFKAINPKAGVKQMFSSQNAWATGKSFLKVVVIAAVTYPSIKSMATEITGGEALTFSAAINLIGKRSVSIVRRVAELGVLIAIVDFIYQKRKHKTNLKMTKEEVKEEAKNSEGNPEVKNKRKEKMYTMSRVRMMEWVAKANVVVVNPVHIAVALLYDPAQGAPRVVAMGNGDLAEKIKEEALLHEVPIVESIPLARALFASCDIDEEIPFELYEGVARLLAFVHRLRRKRPLGGDYHRLPDALTVV
ncbi:MAG: flagellar biosynthesis protein FlhB [Acidimicrobiia bacterium]